MRDSRSEQSKLEIKVHVRRQRLSNGQGRSHMRIDKVTKALKIDSIGKYFQTNLEMSNKSVEILWCNDIARPKPTSVTQEVTPRAGEPTGIDSEEYNHSMLKKRPEADRTDQA